MGGKSSSASEGCKYHFGFPFLDSTVPYMHVRGDHPYGIKNKDRLLADAALNHVYKTSPATRYDEQSLFTVEI